MAFFEQLGKTLTNAGQGVAQQTKNFTEITRLNGVISDKEKQIEQLYTIIGKAYYEAHKNDAFAESGESIQRINDLLAEIARHKEEIKQIKGVTPCPACGAEVPASSAFCPSCGGKIPQTEAAPTPVPEGCRPCPKCGAPVPNDNKFCNSCGAKMEEIPNP